MLKLKGRRGKAPKKAKPKKAPGKAKPLGPGTWFRCEDCGSDHVLFPSKNPKWAKEYLFYICGDRYVLGVFQGKSFIPWSLIKGDKQ